MTSEQTEGGDYNYVRLREAYDAAFREWADKRHQVQLLLQSPSDDNLLLEARTLADAAEFEYCWRRNALAAYLLKISARRVALRETHETDDEIRRRQVALLAQSLWKQAGCPAGTAESDWHRAERLLEHWLHPAGLECCGSSLNQAAHA